MTHKGVAPSLVHIHFLITVKLKKNDSVFCYTALFLLKYLKLLLYNKVYAFFYLLLRLKRTNKEILCKKTW